jgi:hypothetical protein
MEPFDIIVKVDGESPADPESVRTLIAEKEPGNLVTLSIIQCGDHKTVTVELDAYDAEAMTKAELLGGEPHVIWTQGGPGEYHFFGGQEFEMPDVEEFFFVPDEGEKNVRRFVIPKSTWTTRPHSYRLDRFNKAMKSYKDVLRYLGEEDNELELEYKSPEDSGAAADRLDARLKALEEMLEKLTERIEEKIREQRD